MKKTFSVKSRNSYCPRNELISQQITVSRVQNKDF